MAKVTAKEIVRSAGIASEIEVHLTNPQDLDGDKLYSIFLQIKERIGEKEAKTFGNMLRTLEPLSTVNFLHSLYLLEKADWDIAVFNYRNGSTRKKADFLKRFGWERGPREREKGFDDER